MHHVLTPLALWLLLPTTLAWALPPPMEEAEMMEAADLVVDADGNAVVCEGAPFDDGDKWIITYLSTLWPSHSYKGNLPRSLRIRGEIWEYHDQPPIGSWRQGPVPEGWSGKLYLEQLEDGTFTKVWWNAMEEAEDSAPLDLPDCMEGVGEGEGEEPGEGEGAAEGEGEEPGEGEGAAEGEGEEPGEGEGAGEGEGEGEIVPLPQWYACDSDDDCVVFEVECCDHCNGGEVTSVNRRHEAAAKARLQDQDCDGVSCTRRGCPAEVPICVNEVCQSRPEGAAEGEGEAPGEGEGAAEGEGEAPGEGEGPAEGEGEASGEGEGGDGEGGDGEGGAEGESGDTPAGEGEGDGSGGGATNITGGQSDSADGERRRRDSGGCSCEAVGGTPGPWGGRLLGLLALVLASRR